MWSPYGKCQEIVRREWRENCIWEGANVVNLFKETAKKSMAELLLWSSEEFGGREKKFKKLWKELKSIKQNYDHYVGGEKNQDVGKTY